jgi:hypothetical protein
MSAGDRPVGQLSSQVDISPAVVAVGPGGAVDLNDTVVRLLHDMLQVQRQQLEMTREMVHFARDSRQRQQAELEAWQRENQGVVERCREVLGIIGRVHSGMIGDMADYISENEENLLESEFAISEFVDRFGPRLHHLSAMVGVLKQLGACASGEQSPGNHGG